MRRSKGREPNVRPLESTAPAAAAATPVDQSTDDRAVPPRFVVVGLLITVVVAAGVAWVTREDTDSADLTAVPIGSADEFPIGLVSNVVLDVGYTDIAGVEDPSLASPPAQEVQQTRLFVVNLPGLGLLALNQRSPFRGCRLVEVTQAETVEMLGDIPPGIGGGFFDPCHGGLFALDGQKLAGPGTRNLDAFAVRTDRDGTVLVDLTQLHTTTGAEPIPITPSDTSASITTMTTAPTVEASSSPSPRDSACPATLPPSGFLAPEPWLTQYPAGSSYFWYGTDELWTVLPVRPVEYEQRKSVWWSVNFPGGDIEDKPDIAVTWRRLGGDGTLITAGSPGTNAWTADEGWFMIAGIDPQESGCWEVTATYKGASVTYVYEKG